ncbi:methylamine utilization protein MauE [Streptomyces sp. WAC 06738]|uniref:MauE/DoxX family redox-associated membrane protein n=1 Tax=Streptomyces sp. WAC 06738 TaxID=2203210 RepID=UPI000F6F6D50|nr:MauE/DoxX family redox-associated membrane protein [Streptomyces sp. WAC 06738]AZM49720.1 methylamine utilization protein MauE [Streptomyces sp. WAC 06738]
MTSLIAATATGVVLLALLAGAASHLSRPAALPGALTAHRLLPRRAVVPAARAATAAEGLLAVAGTAALLAGHRAALAAVLGAAALVFACYALYTGYALAAGRGGPCGCSRSDVPLSSWVAGRAWAFAGLAAVGAALAAGTGDPPGGRAEWTTAALAAVALAVLLWVLPAAMGRPAATTPAPARSGTAPAVEGGH